MRNTLFKGKSARTKLYTVITAIGITVLLLANLLLTYYGERKMLFADMTPEGYYTLSDEMKSACDGLLKDSDGNGVGNIRITFCADPDTLVGSKRTRIIYFMALAMANRYDNVEVKTVNIKYNPTAVAAYKTTSRSEIEPTDVIISAGAKYRIIRANAFWVSDGSNSYFAFNGEYKLASAIMSLTAIEQPKAYFLTGHGETYYDPSNPDSEMSKSVGALADLIRESGMEIALLDLGKEKGVPEDCALLIINAPTEDFPTSPEDYDRIDYVSELEMLDRYLVNGYGSIIVNKDYSVSLPVFESFLEEWGISVSNSKVIDESNCLPDIGEKGSAVLGVYEASEDDFGNAYYGSYAALYSSPKMVFTDTGYITTTYKDGGTVKEVGTYSTVRTYTTFIGTTDKAVAYVSDNTMGSPLDEAGYKCLAAATVRSTLDSDTNETSFAYLFVTATDDFFSNELLGNPSYSNYDIMRSVMMNLSRTDRYASMELGGLSLNSTKYAGKQMVSTTLSEELVNVYAPDASGIVAVNKGFSYTAMCVFTAIVMLAPAAALVCGAVVFVKRKFL